MTSPKGPWGTGGTALAFLLLSSGLVVLESAAMATPSGPATAIRNGVAVRGAAPPATTPLSTPPGSSVLPPPAGATLIHFDDLYGAPCGFSETTALRGRYAPLGVVLVGPAPQDGGAILNECGGFQVTGHSPPNFLAFNVDALLADEGLARGPETLQFSPSVGYVQVNAGSASSGVITMQAYDSEGTVVDASNVTGASALQTLVVAGTAISRVVISFSGSMLVLDDLSFSEGLPDRDGDGLSDDEEAQLGTDPDNPDTDGDGLRDGFEVRHGFNPLQAGEEHQDPDGDGLDNLAEQAAGTDPTDADSDDDGLNDGAEASRGTNPRDPDSDDDGLSDGAEVNTHGTDPLNSDTDGGGVSDGNEVNRDGTDPLDPDDDRRPNGMVIDRQNHVAVVFDSDTLGVAGTVPVGPGQLVGDCAISTDGQLGFVTDLAYQIWVIDLGVSPPGLALGTNPIPIANPGEDVALTSDGQFLLVCDGSTVAPVSVVDVAARVERSTFFLGSDCNSVDVCEDGSVLVTSRGEGRVRRLILDPAGNLSDTGESLVVDGPNNVYCTPGGGSGVVVSYANSRLSSFLVAGLTLVGQRTLSSGGVSGTFARDGMRVYARSEFGTVAGYGYDPPTASLSAAAVYSVQVGYAPPFYGIDQMALDVGGGKLFVPESGQVAVFDAVSGTPLAPLTHPAISQPNGVCFRTVGDRDHDGLSDDDEAALGTDPDNPDTDGDGLRDGFEVRHGFNPLQPGEEHQDPDADGVDNLAEQAAGTDPTDADTDDDGLNDGAEASRGTNPRDPDSDDDGLSDGAEVNTYGTDPLNPDTDGGGVSDGDEVNRDGTDPLNPADDRPPDLGMVIDNQNDVAVAFDSDTLDVAGTVSVGPGPVEGDCVISPDGQLGFVTDFASRIWVIDLGSIPPQRAPGTNPIPISNPGEDVAMTRDGRFLLVCDGSAVAPVSVVDVAARVERSTFSLGSGCNSVDVCEDGSVLVTSENPPRVRRLVIDPAGNLSDTGESLVVDDPNNVYCAPGGGSGVVVNYSGSRLSSFLVPGLTLVAQRTLSSSGVSGAVARDGTRVYARSENGRVAAYGYDETTASLSAAPLYTLQLGSAFPFYGIDQMALDPSGARLFIPENDRVLVFDAESGTPLSPLTHPSISNPLGVCFRTVGDRDGDGLSDEDEAQLGTDPDNPDTDGDGLRDGFEVRYGFNPLEGGEEHQDPDGDELDNLAEQALGTDPTDADSDDDGLSDGIEVSRGTNPSDPDTDNDGHLDGADNCPVTANPAQADRVHPNGIGDACDDPDQDGVFDSADNCPDVVNADQANRDADPLGDACDPYPDFPLEVRIIGPDAASTGEGVPVTYRLVDRRDGRLVTELTGVRVTLTLTGSAVFGTSANQGILVSGGGTNRALVEFVQGLVAIDVMDPVGELVTLGGEDTEHNGIVVSSDVFQDFEANDGGFTHSGTNDVWEWGVPTSGPGQAASGAKVWATNLEGYYPDGMNAGLVSPTYTLSSGTTPRLELQSWFSAEYCCDPAFVQVSTDGFITWSDLAQLRGYEGGYLLKSFDLSPFAGSQIRVRFQFYTDYSVVYQGWYIDDVALRGLAKTIDFLAPDEDLDGDGLTNAAEVALGTDPRDPDTDDDGAWDGVDNCPLAPNPSQSEADGDGRGDVCDNCPNVANAGQADSDSDVVGDACDNCLLTPNGDQTDSDGDHLGNACDNCSHAYNPSQIDSDRDGIGNACDNCLLLRNPDQADLDGDGFGDACDVCPQDYDPSQRDLDGDFLGDACDNCVLDYNPSQGDIDQDREGDVCDLDDGVVWILLGDPYWLEWQPEDGPTSWNVYQGDLRELKLTGVYTQVPGSNPLAERHCDLTNTWVADPDDPAAGETVFSLVTGVQNGVEGSLGSNSAGVERPNANPCP